MPAYTTHGWEIPGTQTIEETLPVKAHLCGGVRGCLQCRRECKTFAQTRILPELEYDQLTFTDEDEAYDPDDDDDSYSDLADEFEEKAIEALEASSVSLTNGSTVNAQVYATQAQAYAMLALLHV